MSVSTTTTTVTAVAIDTAACARIDGSGGKRVGMCTDRQDWCRVRRAPIYQPAEPFRFRLLCPRHQRPRDRTAKCRDELAPSHPSLPRKTTIAPRPLGRQHPDHLLALDLPVRSCSGGSFECGRGRTSIWRPLGLHFAYMTLRANNRTSTSSCLLAERKSTLAGGQYAQIIATNSNKLVTTTIVGTGSNL